MIDYEVIYWEYLTLVCKGTLTENIVCIESKDGELVWRKLIAGEAAPCFDVWKDIICHQVTVEMWDRVENLSL